MIISQKILGSRLVGWRASECFCVGIIYFDSKKLGNCCIEERETSTLKEIILITCQVYQSMKSSVYSCFSTSGEYFPSLASYDCCTCCSSWCIMRRQHMLSSPRSIPLMVHWSTDFCVLFHSSLQIDLSCQLLHCQDYFISFNAKNFAWKSRFCSFDTWL